MRFVVTPPPVTVASSTGWFPRALHGVTAHGLTLWTRWYRWRYRNEALLFAVIVLLLLVFAWVLFTGSISRRH